MQLGIFANTFKRSNFSSALDAIQAHNLSHIEMNLSLLELPLLESTDSLPMKPVGSKLMEDSVKTCKARAINMVSLAAYFNMSHPDVQQRDLGLEKLELLMQAARALNIKLLSLCTGTRDTTYMWRYHPDNASRVAYKNCLSSMEKALELAERYDLMLGFEPEVNLVVNSPQKARQFLDDLQSSRLKIIFDAANIFPEGGLQVMERILNEAFHLLAPEIILVHAKDITKDGEAGDVAAGKGKLDYKLYLNLLKEINFSGVILLHGLAENDVNASIRHIQINLP